MKEVFRFKMYDGLYFKLVNKSNSVVVESVSSYDEKNGINNYALSKIFYVSTFKDVLKLLKQEAEKMTDKKYYTIIENDSLVVFNSDYGTTTRYKRSSDNLKLLFIYKFENDEIRKTFDILLGHKTSLTSVSNSSSYYNWVCDPRFLDVMLTKDKLITEGKTLYEEHKKLKKNGKVRTYYAPDEEIKESLRSLNEFLQIVFDQKNIDFQVAYKKGKSVYDNAAIHKHKTYVYNIDLKDFYPSCKRELVKKYIDLFFQTAPNKDEIVNRFLDVILINDGLFIGSPVSGCLANTVLASSVKYMKNICATHDMEFSVYADDMTFSSDRRISEKFVKGIFDEAFTKYGLESYFKLNDEKSIGYTGMNRKITGVSINNSDKLTTKRSYYRLLRTMIHHLSKDENPTVNIQKLQGKIAYALMIDDTGKVYNYLMKYKDTVEKYKLCSEETLEKAKKRLEANQ